MQKMCRFGLAVVVHWRPILALRNSIVRDPCRAVISSVGTLRSDLTGNVARPMVMPYRKTIGQAILCALSRLTSSGLSDLDGLSGARNIPKVVQRLRKSEQYGWC